MASTFSRYIDVVTFRVSGDMVDCEAYMYSHIVVAIRLQLTRVRTCKAMSTPHGTLQ